MSRAPGHDVEPLDLTCHFRDLRVSVRGPPDQVSELVQVLTAHFSARDHPASCPSECSFDFVEPVVSLPESTSSPAPAPCSETRDSIAAGFPPCPEDYLALSNRLGGANLSGTERIKRAWTAGLWAKAVVDSRIKTPNRSVQLDLRPRFYAVLRAPKISGPVLCLSANTYWRIVGKLQDSDSISHAFPSELEAKVYFAGASAPSFETQQ